MLILPVGDPVASGLSALFLDYLLEKVKKQRWCGLTAKSCFLTWARPLWTLTILFYISYWIFAPRHLLVSNKNTPNRQTYRPSKVILVHRAPPLTFLACFSPILLRNSGTRKLCLILSCTLEVLLSPLIPDSLPCLMDQVSLHIHYSPRALHWFCVRNNFSRHLQLFPPNLSVLSFFAPSVFVVASYIVSLLQSLPLFGAFGHHPWGGIPKTYV